MRVKPSSTRPSVIIITNTKSSQIRNPTTLSITGNLQTDTLSVVAQAVTRRAWASNESRVVTGHRPSSNIRRPLTPQVQSTMPMPTVALTTILSLSISSRMRLSQATFRTGKRRRRKLILCWRVVVKDPTELMAQRRPAHGQEAFLLCRSSRYLQPLTVATPKRESLASRRLPEQAATLEGTPLDSTTSIPQPLSRTNRGAQGRFRSSNHSLPLRALAKRIR